MRNILNFRIVLLCLTLLLHPVAFAEGNAKESTQTEELELVDEVEQPTITIRKPDAKAEITERREPGAVKEIKVQTGGSTYYLYPKKALGGEFDDVTSKSRPAMWRVHEFDVSGKSNNKTGEEMEEEFDYTSDAPAPPTSQ